PLRFRAGTDDHDPGGGPPSKLPRRIWLFRKHRSSPRPDRECGAACACMGARQRSIPSARSRCTSTTGVHRKPTAATEDGDMADVMSVDKRRALMSRIRGKNTAPERKVFDILKARGISFTTHE